MFGERMFNKGWVHLNRATGEYMKGAWEFVEKVKKDATYVDLIVCTCKDCRNMSHQSFDVVYEHLVIKEMDPTYKIWYHHGEEVCVREEIKDVDMFDVFNMYQSTYEREEVNNESTFQVLIVNFIKK
uniref:Transposase-associated domain-containing protein n=1 Tax=Cucumis melo TaxID=3656 RepID=A0A9I9EEG3_CUCME